MYRHASRRGLAVSVYGLNALLSIGPVRGIRRETPTVRVDEVLRARLGEDLRVDVLRMEADSGHIFVSERRPRPPAAPAHWISWCERTHPGIDSTGSSCAMHTTLHTSCAMHITTIETEPTLATGIVRALCLTAVYTSVTLRTLSAMGEQISFVTWTHPGLPGRPLASYIVRGRAYRPK